MVRANVTCALVGTVCWSRGAPDPLSARRFISRAAVVLPRANLHAREANRRAGRAVGREALVEPPTSPRGCVSRSPTAVHGASAEIDGTDRGYGASKSVSE